MRSVLHEWQSFSHSYRLCRHEAPAPGWVVLPPSEAWWVLRSQLSDPARRQALLAVACSRRGGTPSPPRAEFGALEHDLRQHRLVVLSRPLAPIVLVGLPGPLPAEAKLPPVEPRTRSWVDVIVVDDSDPAVPLAGARFRVGLPDGSTREASLDRQGHLHLDDTEPGRCWIELDELDPSLFGATT